MSQPSLRVGVSYDFRNPPDSGVSDQHLYSEILEQVQWLDQIGADLVWFTEHHFVEDGYLPSWVPVAAAMASAVASADSAVRAVVVSATWLEKSQTESWLSARFY